MNDLDKFKLALKCINQIEDYLEYRYLGYNRGEMKATIMKYIDEFVNNLKDQDNENNRYK